MPPSVSASRILPESHPVFTTIKSDDLDGLIRLLGSREASLRDRDDRGWPLLMVSELERDDSMILCT
jgi:hypothetical protein